MVAGSLRFRCTVSLSGGSTIATPTQSSAGSSAPGLRQILIVDDNVSSAETLALLISLSGHQTRVAHSGAATLEAVEAFRPDVVLLDIGLPGMDGFEVARRLREGDRNRHLLLVAVTGYGQDDDRHRSAAAGFDHHLVKPVDLAELEKILGPGRQD